MSRFRLNSLQIRLATRLGVLFLLATLVLSGLFVYLSYNLVDSLNRRDFYDLAEELADEMEDEGDLGDIDELISRGWLNVGTEYLVLDSEHNILAESDPLFRSEILSREINKNEEHTTFRLNAFGESGQQYFGLISYEKTDIGRLIVIVAEPERQDQELLDAMLEDVISQGIWILPLFILVTLLVGVLAIRGGLKPLRVTAKEAAAINPEAISVRLGTDNLPSEIFPLVNAVNSALDRLEEGFAIQRRFTANAAHELRTPLTIVTGALDNMEDSDQVKKLRQDVARMNRLVMQLLHAARLDSLIMDTSSAVDLGQVAHQVLEMTAMLAIEAGKELELSEPEEKVMVRGNMPAMEDALRNLIENAIAHGTPNTRIDVRVSAEGTISVCDQGPGIPEDQLEHLFDRFWRGQNTDSKVGSAGLGLAIVQEIMKQHDGSVRVETNHDGGTCFILQFRKV
ncbi:MAG: ATP-binding protein [Porticoccaceae bacterium]